MKSFSGIKTVGLAALGSIFLLASPALADKHLPSEPGYEGTPHEQMNERPMQEHMQGQKPMQEQMREHDAPLQYKTESGKQAQVKSEQRFLVESAMASQGEVELGSLAEDRAQSQKVKAYGQTLQTDHSQVVKQLGGLLDQQEVEMPDMVPAQMTKTFSKLSQAKGPQFDRQFLQAIIQEHQRDIQTFEKWQRKAPSQAVKRFIEQTLPKLKQHLETAQQLQVEVGGGKAS